MDYCKFYNLFVVGMSKIYLILSLKKEVEFKF